MKLKDTKQLLNDLNLAPNKNLGQNFLINEEIAESITSLVKNQDYVIEIGPGLGALTKKLAQNNKKVLAIEIDRGFAEYLKKEAEKVNNITILHSDFLKYPLNKIKENINIVSNLPYNITTPIIEKVLLESNKLDKFVFMTQKDFIDRLLSKPGSKEYGPISVLISSLGYLEIFKVINKENFYPQPKISSCVSVFVCKKTVSQNDRKTFYEFVKLLFKERRKTILNNLSAITKDKKEAERKLNIVKILPSRRPETLNIDEIQLLFDIMLNKTRKKMKRKSYSKINLTLDIIKKREDGYHELKMIMLPLELHDEMEFTINNSGKTIIETIIGPKIANNENIIYKTIELMRSLYKFNEGINIKIKKHIPIQSGLGGGSSNAATTINVVNELLHLNLEYKDKLCIAKQVGADVPFFLTNKTAIVEGIGEKVTPIKSIKVQVLLVKPKEGINTKKAYEMYGFVGGDHGNFDEVIEAYNKDDLSSLGERVYNSLERAAFKMEPNIEILKNELLRENCEVVLMSGSGSTIFAMSKNMDKINYLKEKYQNKGYQTITTEVKNEKRK